MSKRTTIYVLFKEYPDPYGCGKSVPYIQDSAEYLVDKDALLQDWLDIYNILDYFVYEPTNKYYDDENLRRLLHVADTFPDEYPGAETTIRAGMSQIGLTSRRVRPVIKTDSYKFGTYNVTDDVLGDMAQLEAYKQAALERIAHDVSHELKWEEKAYEPCVLLHQGAVMVPHGGLQVTTARESRTLATADSIISLHSWISDNRFPRRNYRPNSKHGDEHSKAQSHSDRRHGCIPSAQLLTDNVATEDFLSKAIGESVEGDLWYYDKVNGCFIYFENQGDTPQHEYHAYHLRPGEKNYDKINVVKLRMVLPDIP